MTTKLYISRLAAVILLTLSFQPLRAQGPRLEYYYLHETELPWADCRVYQGGGSKVKIPFLPVINRALRAPCGTEKYTKDIALRGPIVFIGNGKVTDETWDSYFGTRADYSKGDIDVSEKIVMFCYDFPDKINQQPGPEISLEERISQAESRNAAGVILFSHKNETPFLYLRNYEEMKLKDIPVISISRKSASNILYSAGMDPENIFKKWEETGIAESSELISNLELKISGRFEQKESENFMLHYRREAISDEDMNRLGEINERALDFLLTAFQEFENMRWEKLYLMYFKDYDTKVFYTHHWGKGLACEAGIFSVFSDNVLDFSVAVHENTHIYVNSNWGGSSSFMNEGLAKHIQALATDKNDNHKLTFDDLENGRLFPLNELLDHNIGIPGMKTNTGYPASGSFIGFLIDSYGFKLLREAFVQESRSSEEKKMESTWMKVYQKSLPELEKEWHIWLKAKFSLDK